MYKQVTNAIFEMFEMTRTPRSGWQRAGLREGIENDAEHTCLMAQIAFILAVMEGVKNPELVACKGLFHDNGEPRTGDVNKLNLRYFKKTEGERAAFYDFTERLPEQVKERLRTYFNEFEMGTSKHAIILKDADLLQMAFQGKYYVSIGYKFAQQFIDGAGKKLQTDSAKHIFEHLGTTDFFEWCIN